MSSDKGGYVPTIFLSPQQLELLMSANDKFNKAYFKMNEKIKAEYSLNDLLPYMPFVRKHLVKDE